MNAVELNEELSGFGALLLASAVKSIYPTVKLGGGSVGEFGYYFDFEFSVPVKTEDLSKIEDEMKRLGKRAEVSVMEKTKSEAVKLFDKSGEPFLVELAGTRKGKIGIVKLGNTSVVADFAICEKSPSVVKLTQITGAYWKGDAKNKMLTRIYGVAFKSKDELAKYHEWQEDIKRRDHNKIGRELEYFTTDPMIGQGLPLILPKGARIIKTLQRWVEDEEEKRGYMQVYTPDLTKSDLFKASGHWTHYKDGMFVIGDERLDDEVFALKPMNCPFHIAIYKSQIRSYRDLPIRISETGKQYRNENSGEMHGLTRVRQYTLSDAHIFCRPDQVQQIFDECLQLTDFLVRSLGIQDRIWYRFSKWDPNNREKYIDNKEAWEKSEAVIREVLVRNKMKFVEAADEAAFYGPKIDIQAKNVYGKEDTLFTVQLDFALAEKFGLSYIDENGQKITPFLVHRASLGAYERTFAFLLEHFAGALPVWLSPTQAVVMGITNKQDDYVDEIFKNLRGKLRIEKDIRAEKVGYKIREHSKKKIPYLIVVGEKEREEGKISVRTREGSDLGTMNIEEFFGLGQFNAPTE
ncbi:MAG: threonine--tRNA ligase [Firmicutes bacterium]|nr:threonine--tRNA ligase [Bacillota bacterium]